MSRVARPANFQPLMPGLQAVAEAWPATGWPSDCSVDSNTVDIVAQRTAGTVVAADKVVVRIAAEAGAGVELLAGKGSKHCR